MKNEPEPQCAQHGRRASLDSPPSFTGTLRTDEATCRTYAQDYGRIIHERPLAVLLPDAIEDIAAMVRFARRNGLRIAVRGHGHQPFGQAQVSDGVVIDMRSLPTVHAVARDRVEVDAGAEWRAVLRATADRGLTPPVLPNYLGLTVGGTLAIGGIGLATLHHGAQVDQVDELLVVTGEGEVVRCSEREHPDLFESALCGQGQCAIIARAVLRLAAARPMLRELVLPYGDLPTLLEDQRAIIADGRFDGAAAMAVRSAEGWSYALQAVRHFTPPDAPRDAALTAGLHHVRGSEQTLDASYLQHADTLVPPETAGSHPDLGLLIPGPAVSEFLGDALPRFVDGDLGGVAALRVYLWNRRVFTRPLFRVPETETCAYVAMLREATTDPRTVARMLAGNRELFERNRELGGTLYPYSALELTRADWRRHYQGAWRSLIDAKRRYDPDNVFASGPDLGWFSPD